MKNKVIAFLINTGSILCMTLTLISCNALDNNEATLLTISNQRFLIPNIFLEHKAEKSPNFASIDYVRFPEMSFISRQERKLERKSDHNTWVKIAFTDHGYPIESKIKNIRNRLKIDDSKVVTESGIIKGYDTILTTTKEESQEYYSYINDDDQLIILNCHKEGLMKDWPRKVLPICIADDVPWKNNIYITYYFPRELLSEAADIDTKVKSLIESFEFNGEAKQ